MFWWFAWKRMIWSWKVVLFSLINSYCVLLQHPYKNQSSLIFTTNSNNKTQKIVDIHQTDAASLESLLELIPKLYRESTDYHSCAGAALTSAVALFKARGGTGQIMTFMRSLPTRGVGLNVNRDDVRFYSEDDKWKDRMGELYFLSCYTTLLSYRLKNKKSKIKK